MNTAVINGATINCSSPYLLQVLEQTIVDTLRMRPCVLVQIPAGDNVDSRPITTLVGPSTPVTFTYERDTERADDAIKIAVDAAVQAAISTGVIPFDVMVASLASHPADGATAL